MISLTRYNLNLFFFFFFTADEEKIQGVCVCVCLRWRAGCVYDRQGVEDKDTGFGGSCFEKYNNIPIRC